MERDDLSGTVLGQYQVLEALGEGGMARVYKALHPRLKRSVALKVILPEAAARPGFRERFEREAQVIARLQHANIVAVYDFGEANGLPYLVMQYVGGGTLSSLLKRGQPLPLPQAVHYTAQMAHALHHAHIQGIIHRDVKPSNMLLDEQNPGHLLLSDFGIAKLLSSPTDVDSGQPEALQPLTTTGNIIGTPEYMAPEQAQGGIVDARTDIYALGIVLYALLTGQLPFRGTTPLGVLYQQVHTLPPPLVEVNHSVPPALAEILSHALAKRPEERFLSAEAFARALEALLLPQSQIDAAPTLLVRPGPSLMTPSAWPDLPTTPSSGVPETMPHPVGSPLPPSAPSFSVSDQASLRTTQQKRVQSPGTSGAPGHGFHTAPTPLPGQPPVVPVPPHAPRRRSKAPWVVGVPTLILMVALVLVTTRGNLLAGVFNVGAATSPPAPMTQTPFTGPITDTFKVNTNGWQTGNINGDPGLHWTLGNGVYDLIIPVGNAYAQSYFPTPANLHPPANFTLEIAVKQVAGSTVLGYGLIFRESVVTESQQAGVNAYAFTINATGQYQFQVYHQSQAGSVSFSTSPAGTLQTGLGQTNDLKVVVRGETFKLYANNHLLPGPNSDNSWSDASFASGQVGVLVTGDGKEAQEYQFTAFILTPLGG